MTYSVETARKDNRLPQRARDVPGAESKPVMQAGRLANVSGRIAVDRIGMPKVAHCVTIASALRPH